MSELCGNSDCAAPAFAQRRNEKVVFPLGRCAAPRLTVTAILLAIEAVCGRIR
jgi:hypothetical protein